MKKYLTVLLIILTAQSAFAKTGYRGFKNESELQPFADEIVSLISKGSIHEAVKMLKPVWPIPENEIESISAQTIRQLNMVRPRYGKPLSYFLFDRKQVKDTFVKITYVIKYERHVTRWIFIFYRAQDLWKLNNFKWDDKITELLK